MPLTMKLNDHQFTLSDEALKAIAATTWHTRVKERGNMLCLEPTGEEIAPGVESIGGRGSITERNCPVDKARVGHFHTHPRGPADPSWWDAFAIIVNSYEHDRSWLGCRGSKFPVPSGEIQCQTVKRIPTLPEVAYLRSQRHKMRYTAASGDPVIARYLTDSYSFPLRKVPEIISPPKPIPEVPRIETKELVFAGSAFTRYTNLDTGEVTIKQVY